METNMSYGIEALEGKQHSSNTWFTFQRAIVMITPSVFFPLYVKMYTSAESINA